LENNFKTLMESLSESELLFYIDNKTQFQEEAVIAAIDELNNRGKVNNQITDTKQKIIDKIEKNETYTKKSEDKFKVPKNLPKTISIAAKLIYFTICIGLINYVIVELASEINSSPVGLKFIILIISLVINSFIAFMIHLGHKWARTVFLVFSIIGFIVYPYSLTFLFKISIISGIISLLLTGIQIYILVLLFKPDSKEWYIKNYTLDDNNN